MMNNVSRASQQMQLLNSVAIRQEIQRFESVHPSIYAIYDLIEAVLDPLIQQQMREHVVCIEDSFVNSQEWTLSRSVPELKLGVLGTYNSGKSALVHRYLTGSYLQEESPEGGRFKKEVAMDGQSHLLLIRDEGGPPEMQFTHWADAVIFTFSLESEVSFNTIYSYYAKMAHYRSMNDVPVILVGTQDAISETNPRVIDDTRARKLATDLKCCAYYETCAMYGLNVDRVLMDACQRIVQTRYMVAARSITPSPLQTPPPPVHQPSRSYHSQLSEPSMLRGLNHVSSTSSLCSQTVSVIPPTPGSAHSIQGPSPSFRDMLPSPGVEAPSLPPPVERPERKHKNPPPHKDTPSRDPTLKDPTFRDLRTPIQFENGMASRQSMSSPYQPPVDPPSSQDSYHLQTTIQQQANEINGHRPIISPTSTPSLLRKLGSLRNIHKSSSFSGATLLRYASQSSLNSAKQVVTQDYSNVLATPIVGRREKVSKSLTERIDSFLRDFQPNRDKPSLTPVTNRRFRSQSVQEQSGDSSKDFSTPNTTPTPGRKNRRRSNIFSKKDGEDKKLKNGDAMVGSGRVIPVKQGYLYKRSGKPLSKDWQKKYVTLLDDGRLTYHSNLHDYMENSHGKEIKLGRTTVKIPGQRPRGSEVSKVVPTPGSKHVNGQLAKHNESNGQMADAIVISNSSVTPGLQEMDSSSFSCSVPASIGASMSKMETPNVKKKHRRIKSNSKNLDVNPDADCDGYEFMIVSLDNKQWHFEAPTIEEREEWVLAIEQQIFAGLLMNEPNKLKCRSTTVADGAMIQFIRSVKGNSQCADCGAQNPDWASLNLGALICIECSGIHRNLGTHLSRVRSLELDEWPPELGQVMTSIGNAMLNSVWESNTKGRQKPVPTSPREEKDLWIRCKYEQREFLPALPYADVPIPQHLFDAVARRDVRSTILVLAYSMPDIVNTPYNDKDTRTPLHIAAALGNIVLLQLLIWYGANVKLMDHEGFTAAYYAQVSGSKECVQLLQSVGSPAPPPTLPQVPQLRL